MYFQACARKFASNIRMALSIHQKNALLSSALTLWIVKGKAYDLRSADKIPLTAVMMIPCHTQPFHKKRKGKEKSW